MSLKSIILEKFNNGELENLGIKRLCEAFEAKTQAEKDCIRKIIAELEDEGEIVYKDGRFVLFSNSGLFKGVLRGNERGFGFVVTDSGDFFIPNKSLHGALNGDMVIVKNVPSKKGTNDEGEVIKILNRGVKKLVGTFQGENGFGFVIPDDRSYSVDIYIPFKLTRGAKTGDKVLVEITGYPENRRNPEGKVLEIIGKRFDLKTEELSIIKNANLPLEFPSEVIKELEDIPSEVTKKDLKNRKDFRNDLIITIDGDDSRDFDDAISLSKNKNGTYTLGVHIADVSHYVKRNSKIDKEALSRSTSIYFPERVIPMLPEKLSNGICSLNEGVDRLTLSLIMNINSSGEVVSYDICEGVIRSKKRMTYNNVQKMLDGDKNALKEFSELKTLIKNANELKEILSKKRQNRGNIDLTVKESHITVENGKINVEPRSSIEAYKIIEEFMIVANETVAEYVYYMEYPFVYRVHEKPSAEKLEGFKNFLNALGITVKWNAETCHPKDFQAILNKLKESPVYSVVNKVMLRSMQKAKYSPENSGHFGLSSKCYCHFTSPIRRYPDLVVHSIIKAILNGKDVLNLYSEFVTVASNISSENERKADLIERDMDDYYKCRYMRSYIGREFNGVISGVTNFGVFVELENTVEGIVKLETLPKDKYELVEKTFTLKGRKFEFSLGDLVLVKVLGVDTVAKRVEFLLVGW